MPCLLNTLCLIVLISLEDFGLASIFLIGFFLCFCVGVYDIMYGEDKEEGNKFTSLGFFGTAIMLYYYYSAYDLSNPRVFYEWVIYFNAKSIIGF